MRALRNCIFIVALIIGVKSFGQDHAAAEARLAKLDEEHFSTELINYIK